MTLKVREMFENPTTLFAITLIGGLIAFLMVGASGYYTMLKSKRDSDSAAAKERKRNDEHLELIKRTNNLLEDNKTILGDTKTMLVKQNLVIEHQEGFIIQQKEAMDKLVEAIAQIKGTHDFPLIQMTLSRIPLGDKGIYSLKVMLVNISKYAHKDIEVKYSSGYEKLESRPTNLVPGGKIHPFEGIFNSHLHTIGVDLEIHWLNGDYRLKLLFDNTEGTPKLDRAQIFDNEHGTISEVNDNKYPHLFLFMNMITPLK